MFLGTQQQNYVGYDVIGKSTLITSDIRLAMPFDLVHFCCGSEDSMLLLPGHAHNQHISSYITVLDDGKIMADRHRLLTIREKWQENTCVQRVVAAKSEEHFYNDRSYSYLPLQIIPAISPLEKCFRDGFVIVDCPFASRLYDYAREHIDQDQYVSNHHFMQMVSSPIITGFVNEIFGGQKVHLAEYKRAGKEKYLKVGFPYDTMPEPFPLETLGLSCMIPLEDTTDGPCFCRASHTTRINVVEGYPVEKIRLKRGTVVFWLHKTWHSLGRNTNAVVATFAPETVTPKESLTRYLCYDKFPYLPNGGKIMLYNLNSQ